MTRTLVKTVSLMAIAMLIGFTTGCATPGSVESLQSEVDSLKNQLDTASSDSSSAKADAETALQAAQSAQTTADEAKALAEEAAACCVANQEKMERMFGTMQQK